MPRINDCHAVPSPHSCWSPRQPASDTPLESMIPRPLSVQGGSASPSDCSRHAVQRAVPTASTSFERRAERWPRACRRSVSHAARVAMAAPGAAAPPCHRVGWWCSDAQRGCNPASERSDANATDQRPVGRRRQAAPGGAANHAVPHGKTRHQYR
jgi:hypothetical protein